MPDPGTRRGTFVCDVDELSPGEATSIPGACPPVAVFNVSGELLAIDDTCTHSEYSLSQGFVDGDEVECELHFARFSIRTGEALSAPAVEPVGTYPVWIEGDKVYVGITERCVLQRFRS